MNALVGLDDIVAAADLITGRLLRTPTLDAPGLAAHLGVPVTVKAELLQRTGSFKIRGAMAKLLGLSAAERAVGVVAVSGGNHATAVAAAAGELGISATVVMPEAAPLRSVQAARAAGAQVRLTPDMTGAFALLDQLVAEGATLVHPFDDPVVIAAQGTVGLELAVDAGLGTGRPATGGPGDAPEITDVLVSIGGGGLISGVAAALRALAPQVRVWGVETEGAEAMSAALAAGEPVGVATSSVVTTLSAPKVSALTLAHVRELVHEVLVVPDADAVRGSVTFAEEAKLWTEPAAGCLLPAAHRVLDRVGPDVHLGLVVCGGNVTTLDVAGWVARFAATALPPRTPTPA